MIFNIRVDASPLFKFVWNNGLIIVRKVDLEWLKEKNMNQKQNN